MSGWPSTFNRFGGATLMVLSVLGLFLYLKQARALEDARKAQQRALQVERERLEAEVVQRTRDLRELARHLQTAREDERGHLARELHDEMGALLTSAKLSVARLCSKAGAQPEVAERVWWGGWGLVLGPVHIALRQRAPVPAAPPAALAAQPG